MKKENLEKRLKEIETAIAQSLVNLNMLEGGKQECLFWLKQAALAEMPEKDFNEIKFID